jgi:hypothetical protein
MKALGDVARKRILASMFRQPMVKRGIEHRDHWYLFPEYLSRLLNTGQTDGIVQRSELSQFGKPGQDVGVDAHRFRKSMASMDDPVPHRVNPIAHKVQKPAHRFLVVL